MKPWGQGTPPTPSVFPFHALIQYKLSAFSISGLGRWDPPTCTHVSTEARLLNEVLVA